MMVRNFAISQLTLRQRWHCYTQRSSLFLSVLGCHHNGSIFLQQDHHSSYMDASQKLSDAMKDCAFIRCRATAHALHAHLITSGFHCSIFLQNHLLHMYSCCSLNDVCQIFSEIQSPNIFTLNTMIAAWAACGYPLEAQRLFDGMPHRDTVSWNSLMSAYLKNGRPESTLAVFFDMVHDVGPGDSLDPFSLSYALKACSNLGSLDLALELHCFMTRRCTTFMYSDSVVSSLIDMYMKCSSFGHAERVFSRVQNPSTFCSNCMIYAYSKLYGIAAAVNFFRGMPETDAVSWSTVVSLLPQHGCFLQALSVFNEMCAHGFKPNSMTYTCVLGACANLCNLKWGAHLHARILRSECNLDVYTGNGLIDLYAKCGNVKLARKVFDGLEERNIIAWTSLISGVVQFGTKEEGVMLFNRMRRDLPPDHFTIATVLGLCSTHDDMPLGMQFHGCLVKAGFDQSIAVGNALITMYANSGEIKKANLAFNSMLHRDIISWTAILSAFSQSGNIEMARMFFEVMPERNTVTWNTMMGTYVKHGLWEEGLKLYVLMLRVGVLPDQTTFTVVLSACAVSTLSQLGGQVIGHVEKFGLGLDVNVTNSAITMYSKCGQIHDAQKIFDLAAEKNLVTWNAILTAYAQNGHGLKVIEIFEDMINVGNAPDSISFLSLIAGCSHAGLVREGCNYFNSMMDHGVVPSQEHFNCMVDLLGRAGLLDQAKTLIDNSAFQADAMVWGSLLGASRIYNNKEFAECAVDKLTKFDAECSSGLYSLISSMYFASGELGEVADLRKMMKAKGIQKNPGCSWIEINQRVHVFTACGTCHPQMYDVLEVLVMIARDAEDKASCANDETSIDLI